MKVETTDTPRTDACPHCGSSFSKAIGKHSCHFDLETNGRTKLCLTAEALIRANAEIAALNSLMVGWRQRATMSETSLEASKAEVERLRELTAMERFNPATE